MREITLSSGEVMYQYLEESTHGRIVVTMLPIDGNTYFAHRAWYSDKADADAEYNSWNEETFKEKLAWLSRKENVVYGKEVLPDGTKRSEFRPAIAQVAITNE